MDVYLARQPIFDLNNKTYGYELLFRNNRTQNSYNGMDSDESSANVITNSFFGLETNTILAGKKGFINFTANLIKRGVPKLLPVDEVVVEILEDEIIDDELLEKVKELKSLGYIIALDDYIFDEKQIKLFEMCDIVKVDFRTSKQAIENTTKMCRRANKIILAEKVESLDEFEYAKSLGCTFMQGYYFAKPVIMTKKAIEPMDRSFINIIGMLNSPNIKISELAEIISVDAALVVKLLKLVNSAYYKSNEPISTVYQALVMIGLEPLKEWIYLIGLKGASVKGNDELLRLAFMRAHFCKEIALNIPGFEKNANEMHLMGLISLMYIFFGTTLRDMLYELPVSEKIKKGIMGNGDIYSEVYKLCYAYERGAWTMVDICTKNLMLSSEVIGNCYIKCANFIQEFWTSFIGSGN